MAAIDSTGDNIITLSNESDLQVRYMPEKVDVTYQTSCRGRFTFGEYKCLIIGHPRASIESIIKNLYDSDFPEESEKKERILRQKVRTFIHVERMRRNDESTGTDTQVCPIVNANIRNIRFDGFFPSYLRDLFSGESDEYKYYLRKNIPHVHSKSYIIVPNMSHYPITSEDIKELALGNRERVLIALYKMKFELYLKSGNDPGGIRYISDLTTKKCIEVEEYIKIFYESIVDLMNPLLEKDELTELIYCNVVQQKIGILRFEFGLFPVASGFKYKKYTDHYTGYSLFEIKSILESGQKVVEFDMVPSIKVFSSNPLECDNMFAHLNRECMKRGEYHKTEDDDELEKKSFEYADKYVNYAERWEAMVAGNTSKKNKKYRLVGGIEPIHITNHYAFADEDTHCSDVVKIERKGKFYTVSIANITFTEMKDEKIKDALVGEIFDIIQDPKDGLIVGGKDGISGSFIGNTTATLLVSIKKTEPTNEIRYITIESGKYYKDIAKERIKNATIENGIVIQMIAYSYLRDVLGIYEFKKSDMHSILDRHHSDEILPLFQRLFDEGHSSLGFDIMEPSVKMYEGMEFMCINFIGHHRYAQRHVMWYCPKYEIKNVDDFKETVELILRLSKKNEDLKTNQEIRESLDNSTDFYDLFRGKDFLHNIREAHTKRREIDEFLTRYLRELNLCGLSQKYGNIFTYAHYSNMLGYSIFHMHITPPINTVGRIKKDDLNNRYLEELGRGVLWEKWKHYKLDNINMKIMFMMDRYSRWNNEASHSGREELIVEEKALRLQRALTEGNHIV